MKKSGQLALEADGIRDYEVASPELKLAYAVLVSWLIHVLLLCLTFGGHGRLPGFSFPWQDRRIAVPEPRVLLIHARITAAKPAVIAQAPPLRLTLVEPPVSKAPPRTPRVTTKGAQTKPKEKAAPEAAGIPAKDPVASPARADAQSRADMPGDLPPPVPTPDVLALRRDEPAWVIPPPAEKSTPIIAATPGASSPQTVTPSAPDPGDAARIESARLEAERVEAARVEARRLEAERQESARAEVARVEAARLQAERQESARAEAARVEAARLQAQRQEAARVQAMLEAARIKAEQEEAAARREERLRALGRELDEAAARRDAAREARAAASQSPSYKPLRRYRLLGRTDSNAEIILYAEAFSRKIELNMTIEMIREAAKARHINPLVTVAIRSDGSVESLTFIRSSGVAAIDLAIRRIVASQEPYLMFPPALAREYDVIEIRRSWHFDVAVRLY